MIKVIKRDGREVEFDRSKIEKAIEKAMIYGSGIIDENVASQIAQEIEMIGKTIGKLTIFQIEDMVYGKLIEHSHKETAKAYEGYRAVQEFKRENNTTDGNIIGLLEQSNKEVMNENSNKDAVVVSTQRDLIAGEVSKDIVDRFMYPPHIIQAHKNGIIHQHDKDYLAQPLHNCEIINLEDMLKNGTVINKKQISTPNSFQVACTVTTQIIAGVTSASYGGASINGIDRILAPYARKSFDKYYKKHYERLSSFYSHDPKELDRISCYFADEDMRKEIKDGVQTMQYQINTLSSTNG